MKERIGYYKRFEHSVMALTHKDSCTVCERIPTHPANSPNQNCYSVEIVDGILYVSKWEHEYRMFTPILASSHFEISFN